MYTKLYFFSSWIIIFDHLLLYWFTLELLICYCCRYVEHQVMLHVWTVLVVELVVVMMRANATVEAWIAMGLLQWPTMPWIDPSMQKESWIKLWEWWKSFLSRYRHWSMTSMIKAFSVLTIPFINILQNVFSLYSASYVVLMVLLRWQMLRPRLRKLRIEPRQLWKKLVIPRTRWIILTMTWGTSSNKFGNSSCVSF